jgi:hypothetical protein
MKVLKFFEVALSCHNMQTGQFAYTLRVSQETQWYIRVRNIIVGDQLEHFNREP